jgi:uncharacterized repeat protein (TIGR04076 family)
MKGVIAVVEMPGPCPIHKVGDSLTFGAQGDGGFVEGRACMPALMECLKPAMSMRWEGAPEGPTRIACPDNGNVVFEVRCVG